MPVRIVNTTKLATNRPKPTIPVSLNTVQRWELGLTVPYPATQRRLIEVLEISPDELFAALDATEAERGKGAA